MPERDADQFSKKEAKQRFEAALRGARFAQPTPMKSMVTKRIKVKRTGRKTPS
jgi:hypothetical protein